MYKHTSFWADTSTQLEFLVCPPMEPLLLQPTRSPQILSPSTNCVPKLGHIIALLRIPANSAWLLAAAVLRGINVPLVKPAFTGSKKTFPAGPVSRDALSAKIRSSVFPVMHRITGLAKTLPNAPAKKASFSPTQSVKVAISSCKAALAVILRQSARTAPMATT